MAYELGTPVGLCCLCSSVDEFGPASVTVGGTAVSYYTAITCGQFGGEGAFAASQTNKSCNLLRDGACISQLGVTEVVADGERTQSYGGFLTCQCFDGCSTAPGHQGIYAMSRTASVSTVTASLTTQGGLSIGIDFSGNFTEQVTGSDCPEDPGNPPAVTTTTGTWVSNLNLNFQLACENAGTGCDRSFSVWREQVRFACAGEEWPANCPTNCTSLGPIGCLNGVTFDPTDYGTLDAKVKVVLVGIRGDVIFSETIQANQQFCGAYADGAFQPFGDTGPYWYNVCRCTCPDYPGDGYVDCTENTTVTVTLALTP